MIAEIGVNHDGSFDRAQNLISAASAAHATAVKFQYFKAEHLLSRQAILAAYQRANGAVDPFEMLQRLELSVDMLKDLVTYAKSLLLEPIVTIFSLEDVQAISALDWSAFKLASPDIVNRPLIEAVLAQDRPVLFSTGAASMNEIGDALAWTYDCNTKVDFGLMQCVSCYPTPAGQAQLGAIATLRDRFKVPVGYSDHTLEECTGAFAVAAGAVLIEKHLTHSRRATGPDHKMSLEPNQFQRYVESIRSALQIMGDGCKSVLEIERDVRQVARQSIVATRMLKVGTIIARNDITVKRPGSGLAPALLNDIVGQVVLRPIECGQMISVADIEFNTIKTLQGTAA